MHTVADAIAALDTIAPPELCLGNDPRGLLLGDPAAPLRSIGVALDITSDVAGEACRQGHGLLVAHHPLIYHPLRSLRSTDPFPAPVVAQCLSSGIAVACAHTNWDVVDGGVNDVLAALLGLQQTQPLKTTHGTALAKIVVFVPQTHAEAVRSALFEAGAGAIGDYDECSFHVDGIGTFRPLEGSNPFLGQIGKRESVAEARIEVILPARLADHVVDRARAAHPYEEMAHYVVPLTNQTDPKGIGRVGNLEDAVPADTFLDRVQIALEMPALRHTGVSAAIRRVAVCGGAGAEFLTDAVAAGADAFVTSDVRHHEFVDARERGILLVDAGHAQTETPGARELARRLAAAMPKTRVLFHEPDGRAATV